MFPLTNKEPYIKPSGERTTLGELFAQAGGDISELEQEVNDLKEALTDEAETRSALGAKNFLKITRTSGTIGNVVITNNGDTLTLEGKANASNNPYVNDNVVLKNGSYVLSFGTSAVEARIYGWNGSWVQLGASTGEVSFTASSDYTKYMATMGIINGTIYDTTVYPMIRLATDSDPTYQPYAMTNQELTDAKANKSDLASISITGTTNNTGSSIASGTYFYLNGALVRAKADIASGATFTLNTNYAVVTVGEALSTLNNKCNMFPIIKSGSGSASIELGHYRTIQICGIIDSSSVAYMAIKYSSSVATFKLYENSPAITVSFVDATHIEITWSSEARLIILGEATGVIVS